MSVDRPKCVLSFIVTILEPIRPVHQHYSVFKTYAETPFLELSSEYVRESHKKTDHTAVSPSLS